MKKLIVLAVLVLTLVVGVVSPAAADDSATVKLFDDPFRQGHTTEAFWASDHTSSTLDSLDSEHDVRVFDSPSVHSRLAAILVKKGNDIFRGPYTRQRDKLYTVVGNQVRVGRKGTDPAVGPQAVVYTIEHDGRYLRVYDGNYTKFRAIIYTIDDGKLYRGAYPRLNNLVFTSQGDLDSILFLLPILADSAY